VIDVVCYQEYEMPESICRHEAIRVAKKLESPVYVHYRSGRTESVSGTALCATDCVICHPSEKNTTLDQLVIIALQKIQKSPESLEFYLRDMYYFGYQDRQKFAHHHRLKGLLHE
jgi:hypothetical protein